MSKKDDINIIKHELLKGVLILTQQKTSVTPEMIIELVYTNKNITSTRAEIMAIFLRLQKEKLIIVDENKMLLQRWFVKELSTEGLEALIHKTYLKEYRKEKRNTWNETGQILSPYISIAALLITATLFVVDKCSQPKSYELTISAKHYILKEKEKLLKPNRSTKIPKAISKYDL